MLRVGEGVDGRNVIVGVGSIGDGVDVCAITVDVKVADAALASLASAVCVALIGSSSCVRTVRYPNATVITVPIKPTIATYIAVLSPALDSCCAAVCVLRLIVC